MAKVVRAWDELLRVERAVKLLSAEAALSPLLRTRLLGEATAMARLNHPNVLRVIDLNAEHSPPFVVMELAVGGSLADRLEREGPLPVGEATHLIAQTCLALQAAHEAGIIHRDVKPQNILIGAGGAALLADFGIALLGGDGDLRTTRTNIAMGSMCFMAPEQRLDARAVGPAADVYAAACALYNLLTDENPIDLFTAAERSPRWLPVPVALREVLRRATAYAPEERPESARALAVELLSALGEDAVTPPALAERTALAMSWRREEGEAQGGGPTAERTFDGLLAVSESSLNVPPGGGYTPTMPPSAPYTPTAPPTPSRVTAPEPQPRAKARWIPLGGLLVGVAAALLWWGAQDELAPPAPTAPVLAPARVEAPIEAAAPPEPVKLASPAPRAPPVAAPRAAAPRVVEPPLTEAPQAARGSTEAAEGASPAPSVGASPVAGAWRGAFGGHVARLTLRGEDDALRGVFIVEDRSGVVVVESPVEGRFDAASGLLSLADIDQQPEDAARYTLRLTQATRLEGASEGTHTASRALVVLNRSS